MSNQFVEWFAPFRQRSRRFANEIVSFIDGSAALILGHLRIRADRTSAVGQLFVRCDATIRCGAYLQLHASFTVPTLPKELPLSVSGRLEGKGDAAGAVLRLVF